MAAAGRFRDRLYDAIEAVVLKVDALRLWILERAAHHSSAEHIICAAYISLFVGSLETYLSYEAGLADQSDGVLGVAIMGLVEILGSALVLYRWQFKSTR